MLKGGIFSIACDSVCHNGDTEGHAHIVMKDRNNQNVHGVDVWRFQPCAETIRTKRISGRHSVMRAA